MDLGIKGKVAMITGASAGIGNAAARVLAEEGARISICARSLDQLERARQEIRKETDADVLITSADFNSLDDIQRFVSRTAEHYGSIDILVNSVGSSMFGSFSEVPDERWEGDIHLKLLGTVRACRAALPHMTKGGGGRIINVAGNSGKQPYRWHLPGGAANAAMLNFTHSLAEEVSSDGILVTAVCPGPVLTRRFDKQLQAFANLWGVSLEEAEKRYLESLPLGRAATPEEVANLIAFLASEKASYISGTAVTIDGCITKGI